MPEKLFSLKEELEAYGMTTPEEWRGASETPSHEELFQYLKNASEETPAPPPVETFEKLTRCEDSIERLRQLAALPLRDAIHYLQKLPSSPKNQSIH